MTARNTHRGKSDTAKGESGMTADNRGRSRTPVRRSFDPDLVYRPLVSRMLGAVAVGSIVYDKRGRPADFVIEDVNPTMERLIRLKSRDVIGRRVGEAFPAVRAMMADAARSLETTGRLPVEEYYSEIMGGRWLHLEAYTPQRGICVMIFNDITERKKAEERLRASEERFRTLIERSSDITLVVDAKGLLTFVSPSVERVLGYTPQELIGTPAASIVHPDDLAATVEGFRGALKHPMVPARTICRCRHKSGHWRVIEGTSLNCLDNPAIRGFVANVRDTTEKTASETALRDSEDMLRRLVEQSVDGIVLIDNLGVIVEYNASQERMTGVKRSGALGKFIWDVLFSLFPHVQRTPKAYARFRMKYRGLLRTGKAEWLNTIIDHQLERPDGRMGVMQSRVFPIALQKRRLYASINRDMTGLRETERVLRERETELSEQNKLLQEKNVAMREVLSQLEVEKKSMGRRVQANVDRLVLPVLARLRQRASESDLRYLDMLEEDLRDLTGSFGEHIGSAARCLTQREIEICDMIRRGQTSKEAGRALGISHRTVETVRYRIRRKLRVPTDHNLTTYLRNL
jgi:PAS domain S-box-containing protein